MIAKRIGLLLLICCMAIAAAAAVVWLTKRPAAYIPEFIEHPCPMEVPAQYTLRCGTVTVPENRAASSGRQVVLSVAVAEHPTQDAGATPLVFLNGGPGSRTMEVLPNVNILKKIVAERPVVFFDQRGVGFSEPLLDCPEADALTAGLLRNDLEIAQANQLTLEAYDACRIRLENEGVSLDAYTTAASADDVRDIVKALGYPKVYLLGLSYGTRLAQVTILRHQAEGWIAGAILDSAIPLQAAENQSFWPNVQAAFQHIFDRCAAEATCAENYPELKTTFIETMDALEIMPLDVEVFDPFTGEAMIVKMNDDIFYEILFPMLYGRDDTAKIPALIQQVHQHQVDMLADAIYESLTFILSTDEGMSLSVSCTDEGFAIDLAAIETTNAALEPVFARLSEGNAELLLQICQAWGVLPPNPAENMPLQTDLPVLILAGDQDPITPAVWAALIHEDIPSSYLYTFPGVGHAVMMTIGKTGICAESLMQAFLNDSGRAPDGACVANIQPLPFRKP